MKIALIGNQNSGKTSLFNYLTGMNSKIGNWPGVTIEKKVGIIKNTNYEIVDLPGIYSLSPYSIEEEIARKFIFEEKPDVIINIIDACNIERSLYLTTQILELDCKIIIALNMVELAKNKGIEIDCKKLEEMLGVDVIKISAKTGKGTDELKRKMGRLEKNKIIKIFSNDIEEEISNLSNSIDVKNKRFVAVKLLENDKRFIKYQNNISIKLKAELESKYSEDIEEIIASKRYSFIEKVDKNCVKKIKNNVTISEKLDKVFLNRFLAFPIFALIVFLIYYLSVGVIGKICTEKIFIEIENFKVFIANLFDAFKLSIYVKSLIIDGIITSVTSVLAFIPQLIVLFLCIGILEATGYMSRIAFLLDGIFRKVGLSGKSLIPFILGSGCSVPGIMGTRIIENYEERKMTAILTPFIPCSAKLPIMVLFSSYFYPENSAIICVSLYFLAIIIIITSAYIMKKIIFNNTNRTFIFEMPDYRLPNIKYLLKDVYDKVLQFIKRAGTIILFSSILVWFLLSFSPKMEYGINIENSILALMGKKISWIFVPMIGKNSWEASVSCIQGLIAKEQVISSMNIINGISESNSMFSEFGRFNFFNPISAYSFMIFNLFSIPCISTISVMKSELNYKKSIVRVMLFEFGIAWILATAFYQIGNRIKQINLLKIISLISIAIIIVKIIKLLIKNKCQYCEINN